MRPLLVFVALVAALAWAPGAGAQAEGSALRISEFSGNPAEAGNDGAYEWVELENVSGGDVALEGWAVGDGKTLDVLGAVVVPVGGFVVVAGAKAQFAVGTAVVRTSDGSIGSGLNNDGDEVRLADPTGAVVDVVRYGGARASEVDGPVAPPAGRSAAFDRAEQRWRTAIDPTPGAANDFPDLADPEDLQRLAGKPEVRFETGESMPTAGWVLLAAVAGAGIAGLAELAYRRRGRWRRAP